MVTTARQLAGLRLLLVEDEFFLAEDMAKGLAAQGAEVIGPVPSIDGALDLIAACGRLDGALLDVNLQGEMAFPVADALAERGVPFMFITGYDASSIPERYAGVTRREKPIEPADIARALLG